MKFNILDLFCGAGGFSSGLDQLENFETKIGIDFDKHAINTFSKNFPGAIGICGDITSDKIKEDIIVLAKRHSVNMIIGGPPCQGFSLKGKNLGLNDPRNFLFKEYLDIVDRLQPDIFIIENVKNLCSAANGYFKTEIKKEIENLGYIVNVGILNSKDYGVPQLRERTFFIASKTRFIHFPAKQALQTTVRDAISDLAYLNSGEGKIDAHYLLPPASEYQKKLRGQSLQYHVASSHSKVALDKLQMIPPEKGKEYLPKELHGKQKFSTTWSRLEWDTQSPTIDTRFDTPSNGKNSHPFLHRAITPREAARIQSFHDDFYFYGNKCSVCKQIGNAVPPLIAKAIGEQIVKELNYMQDLNDTTQLFQGDAYTIINELKKKKIKVDHIITDPPYNISKENNFSTLICPRQGVDFGEWDKDFDLYSWIKEYEEILNPNGSMIIFCSYRFLSYVINTMEESNIAVKDVLVWKKSNPMPRNIKRRYVQDMEFAVWGVKKNAKWVFNKDDNLPYMRSLFESPLVSGKERMGHPTQKSIALMKNIIKIHTNPGQTILDPFMGSGSTGVAATELNRRFIGIELDADYYKIASRRINS